MATLSESQKQAFNAVAVRLGFQPGETTSDMSHPAFAKKVVTFGSGQADITGKVIPVSTIADLKKIVGLPEPSTDDHIDYPPPLSAPATSTVPPALNQNLKMAAAAYLSGEPAKVVGYEDLINKLAFPRQVFVYNMEKLAVADGQVVVLGISGQIGVYNYGTITRASTGQIHIAGNTFVSCQVFTTQAPSDEANITLAAAETKTLNFFGPPYSGGGKSWCRLAKGRTGS